MNIQASPVTHCFPEVTGYKLVEQLYSGSRTAVYRAIQEDQQRQVVIKVLQRDYPSFGELVQFRNQYTIATNLPIPGIVQPLSLEPLGNSYALVMEDSGGVALSQYVTQQSLGLKEVLTIALQIADILQNLSQHQVVHKDIKPANILIHPESKEIKLIDFSIASLLPKETQEIQSPNVLEGTLAYLAPEQTGRMNRGIDYRSDFYGLGVTLYQLLSGDLPFTSNDPLELVHCHIAQQPVPIDQINSNIPAMVAAIVTKLMAKNAEDRYQSAIGLKHDLQQCLTQWKETEAISAFELGQRDISDRFLIPEKLYGREAEVQTLLNAFDRVAEGTSELMLVAGFSGIGKTAIVNEVHKPIVRQHGYFIRGKYDQFNRYIPLSAFVQALRDLMQQLLAESDVQLAKWKEQILAAVESNGQVLIEVIPELEQIIGKQPPAPELAGNAAQNRFNLLFPKFVEVFSTHEHPLVIFLDDLQWADSASLQLIKLLMNDHRYLLMLGAYRDNEVSPAHPFILTVDELQKAGTKVNTITLSALTFADANHWIADTLSCPIAMAKPLTSLVMKKTQGNPFFLTQFLKALYEEGLIAFNHEQHYWECDIAEVTARSLTDDVVEFMAQQLQKLPSETQDVLKLAACIGNQFDLNTLAIVSRQSPTEAATALWKALQEELILPTSQIYKLFQTAEVEQSKIANPRYRFLHDRVQQAAYSLIPEEQKKFTHLTIGQLLQANTPEIELETHIFTIVSHLNAAIELIKEPTQKIELAQLNQIAGRKAKNAIAYETALTHYSLAVSLLPDTAWQTEYDLSLSLHEGATEASYQCGDFEKMQEWAEILQSHAKTDLDCTKVYELQMSAQIVQKNPQAAVTLGLDILRRQGIDIPANPTPADVEQLQGEISALLPSSDLTKLVEAPVMTDENMLATMEILMPMNSASFVTDQLLFSLVVMTQIKLSLLHGNAASSAAAYAGYGMLLNNAFQQHDLGYQSGVLALALAQKFGDRHLEATTIFGVTGIFLQRKSLRDCITLREKGILAALESGNLEFLGWSYTYNSYDLLFVSETLRDIEPKLMAYGESLQKHNQLFQMQCVGVVHQTLLNLMEPTETPDVLNGKIFNETPLITHPTNEMSFPLGFLYTSKLYLGCIFSHAMQAWNWANVGRSWLLKMPGNSIEQFFLFYDSLAQLMAYDFLSEEEQAKALEQVAANQPTLQTLSDRVPMNYQAKLELVKAEHFRVMGQFYEAGDWYDRAIASAQASHFIQEQALANERAAQFYLDWGKVKIAMVYLQAAYDCYRQWGAQGKVIQLEQKYSQLLTVTPTVSNPLLKNVTGTSFTQSSYLISNHSTHHSTSTSTNSNQNLWLDLPAVMKAAQAISQEIELEKLLATLMQTMIANAGAQTGALVMHQAGQWMVVARANATQTNLQPALLDDCTELPKSLIYSVGRNHTTAVFDDLRRTEQWTNDRYVIKAQPKSALCTPILLQGNPIGILYLENNLTVGAFTGDRVEILQILTAQAAISIENARLYQQMAEYSQTLELEVARQTQDLNQKAADLGQALNHLQQTQTQLIHSEKMSALGQLVAGIAHEINNPITFIHGNLVHTENYVQDLLNLLDLYETEYPEPTSAIQTQIEEIDLEFVQEDLIKILRSMESGSDRIKKIVLSLRNFSRLDESATKAVDLHSGIESTLLILQSRLQEQQCPIEVIKTYGDLPKITCNASEINQVILSLLNNALDALKAVNSIDRSHQIQIRTTIVGGDRVSVSISDTGIGIPMDVQPRIFDPFFTTKPVGSGTGLGLSVSYAIIHKHGGSLTCQSEPGRGTTFVIELPILV